MNKKVLPRKVPDRDSKYMALAWIHASFSKDPSTQVGAVIISENNVPLGSGYNGPPSAVDDYSFSWERGESPEDFSKNDIIIHAEANAIDYTCEGKGMLENATIYCTAMPCPECMKRIVKNKIRRVVYMDYLSNKNSSLQNSVLRNKSVEIAKIGKVKLDKFAGNLNWVSDWLIRMRELGIFDLS